MMRRLLAAQGVTPAPQRAFTAYGIGNSKPRALVATHAKADAYPAVYKACVAVKQGPTALVVKTKDGVVTLAFYPNRGVKEALAELNGVQVTCMITSSSSRLRPAS